MIENLPKANDNSRLVLKPIQTKFHLQGVNRVQMIGNSGLLVCCWDYENHHYLQYKDLSGNSLSQYKLNSRFAPLFERISQNQLVVVKYGERETLIIWNVQTGNKTVQQLSFSLSSNARLFIFPETKLICLVQRRKTVFHVSYFQLQQDQTIRLVNEHSFDQPTQQVLIPVKIDKYSKIALIPKSPARHSGSMSLYIYTPNFVQSEKAQLKNQLREHIWNHEISSMGGDEICCRISDAWMVEPTVLYLQLEILKKLGKKYKYLKTNNFYWNIEDGSFKKSKLEILHRLQFTGNLRNYFVDMKDEDDLFPIYFMNYGTEAIVGKTMADMRKRGSVLPIATNEKLMSYDFNLGQRQMQIKIWEIPYKIWEGSSIIATNFMVQCIEDCDEELIFYVCQLLRQNPQGLYSFQS